MLYVWFRMYKSLFGIGLRLERVEICSSSIVWYSSRMHIVCVSVLDDNPFLARADSCQLFFFLKPLPLPSNYHPPPLGKP
ncbi:hypothetical protein QVD17_00359 [Tagetes erecta]|uniref:Uncharacterized protein n=1 Tax=Tagetes erecta TaxID=13708 RepID=A0AAD8P7B3_TARER|nr:hypothetical protein QVD17_00359 [Tagetes erecta]